MGWGGRWGRNGLIKKKKKKETQKERKKLKFRDPKQPFQTIPYEKRKDLTGAGKTIYTSIYRFTGKSYKQKFITGNKEREELASTKCSWQMAPILGFQGRGEKPGEYFIYLNSLKSEHKYSDPPRLRLSPGLPLCAPPPPAALQLADTSWGGKGGGGKGGVRPSRRGAETQTGHPPPFSLPTACAAFSDPPPHPPSSGSDALGEKRRSHPPLPPPSPPLPHALYPRVRCSGEHWGPCRPLHPWRKPRGVRGGRRGRGPALPAGARSPLSRT